LLERSPMLWFFAARCGENNDGRYEAWVNEQFLDCRFVRATTNLRNYVRGARDLNYRLSPVSVAYPSRHTNDLARYVVDRADGNLTMREILQEASVNARCHKTVADLRVRTTTSLCPYLRPTRFGAPSESPT